MTLTEFPIHLDFSFIGSVSANKSNKKEKKSSINTYILHDYIRPQAKLSFFMQVRSFLQSS